jgi:hypothetical protein
MGINFGGILGGIAGLLVPGSTFLAPAIGAGLGTLAGGGSFKNAIKYGLLAGGANTAFGGGIGGALKGHPMGAKLSGVLGDLGIAGGPLAAPGTIGATANKGILSNPLAQAVLLSSIVPKQKTSPLSYEGYDGTSITEKEKEARLDNLFSSRFDGTRFNTPEERDQYDDGLESSMQVEGMEVDGLYARGGQIEGLGGLIEGPGTGTSDDIPAMIYQDGNPVQEAMLSNGEVVLSLKDLRNIGGGNAEMAGKMIGDAPNGTRGAVAAKLFRNMQEFKNV